MKTLTSRLTPLKVDLAYYDRPIPTLSLDDYVDKSCYNSNY